MTHHFDYDRLRKLGRLAETLDEFIDMLPSVFRRIGPRGVHVHNRLYDSAALDKPEEQTPPHAEDIKTEVKYSPYDPTHVWVRTAANTWLECRWP